MVLITGASSGIGESCARFFAASGWSVILLARRRDRLEELAATLRAKHGAEAHAFAVDVTDDAAVARFFKEQSALVSRVSVLVNNAGLARGRGPIQDGDPDDWDVMWNTNVRALLHVTKAMLPSFVKRGEGHVVNIGSAASRWAYPGGNVYSATKRAVSAISESMRIDLNGTGVRVTEVSPGMVETEFSIVRFGGDVDKAKAVYAGVNPLTPDDVAEAVLWCVNRPRHVNIQEVVLYPTDQASTSLVHRRGK